MALERPVWLGKNYEYPEKLVQSFLTLPEYRVKACFRVFDYYNFDDQELTKATEAKCCKKVSKIDLIKHRSSTFHAACIEGAKYADCKLFRELLASFGYYENMSMEHSYFELKEYLWRAWMMHHLDQAMKSPDKKSTRKRL